MAARSPTYTRDAVNDLDGRWSNFNPKSFTVRWVNILTKKNLFGILDDIAAQLLLLIWSAARRSGGAGVIELKKESAS